MAVFNINTDCLTNADYSSADDIKKVKSYLYRLNDQLQYMFANMTVNDNFSSDANAEYTETKNTVLTQSGQIQEIKYEMSSLASTASIHILENEINAEVTRATGAEGSLSSRITQTATDITSEVTRATTVEGSLSSRITQTATDITSEVTRATGAEGGLSSRITQNSDQIALKVNSSDLLNSSLTIKPAAISIESGGTIDINAGSSFTVNSTNFKIDENGNVYMTGSFEQLNAVNDLVEITSEDTGGLLGWTAGSIRLKDVGVSPGSVAETNIIINGSGNIVANDYYIYDENGTYTIEGKTYSSIRDLLHL